MEFIRGIHNVKLRHRNCVFTVGNFDGFHLGHQYLISKLHCIRIKQKIPIVVMIFEPQPKEYLLGKLAPARISSLRDKVNYLFSYGVDAILCIPFNKYFSSISAKEFISEILVKKLGINSIGVGKDFQFGKNREGNISILKKKSKEIGFNVIDISEYFFNKKKVSSTIIRNYLYQDRISLAEKLLGHKYCISGRIVHGRYLGKILGFPTANIYLKNYNFPIHGVYAVQAYGIEKNPIFGIANIGLNPTVSKTKGKKKMEVHFLNINKNLYGYYASIVIKNKIRNEKKFSSLKELKEQISNDLIHVKKYFNI
ncbi:bifunctional riboflavin kinase/FAD synthetase [bacterium endosymbiont of Pedicinus badii]|uniref:bifunctional riboflavin kinase/FAD synthetase n=1 Tax=bacterium endosymbiont of Pedicinus badii TaxID=1719126 RepID=UPI0009B98AB2|nr:bifunctional riboflavin kinase/FAD synthetase [bacterium endosymbiont of Pedicinus badii]OQM34200.1 hypothetical protein AOQ89_02610 [bacterium endosymbiont of Pedicinus badii]